jgi:TetR/AcrR family transcriptional repressor of mexJK operon
MLISESARFEDLARDYRDRAPDMILRALAASFSDLSDRGLLEMDDPPLAAEHFAFLVIGAELDRGMFTSAPPSPEEARRRAAAGARAFLRAYGANRSAS